jgi:hypothetical protein
MSPEHEAAHEAVEASGETWISIAEAAERSGRSPAQFYVWRSKGKAPIRIEEREGRVCVHAEDLRRWTLEHPKRGTLAPARRAERPARASAPTPAPAPETSAPPADARQPELVPAPRASGRRSFSFRCETGAELRAWADFLDELGRRGVELEFRVDGGRITLA